MKGKICRFSTAGAPDVEPLTRVTPSAFFHSPDLLEMPEVLDHGSTESTTSPRNFEVSNFSGGKWWDERPTPCKRFAAKPNLA
ncbi:uncharacterized protein LDX57_001105 [Aspergillus melleus]|uniref:uncharacterized protein n=1 Tax=Aspergillus melleus TaxID=138277 RepID=UPI001E8DFDAD|nr:uncharacterized protein LDX57_001105 [Aspergillus melleus]KAH8423347.1 hypothetical protein LDX57_001105 [Aspergillus melleus]